MSETVYKRIMLKLSGQALEGDRSRGGIDFPTVERFCGEIIEVARMGVQVCIVVGGGNIFRGEYGEFIGLKRPTADYMGMLATVINALAIQASLESRGIATRVMSAIEMPPVAERYIWRRAIRHLDKGRVVIFAAGTGNPFFTTDTAAALRASEVNAELLIKATRVDGIYNADPKIHADATRYTTLTYSEILSQKLRIMDATAISLCRENKMPVLVFDLTTPGNLVRVIKGEPLGTLVKED